MQKWWAARTPGRLLSLGTVFALCTLAHGAEAPRLAIEVVADRAAPVARSSPLPAPKPARARHGTTEPVADPTFESWLGTLRAQALAAGIRDETLTRELGGLRFNPRVVELDQLQPDRSAVSTVTFAGYSAKQLSGARIAKGRRLRSDLSATLSSIEAQYGVPGEILLAIWGIETSYGANAGNLDVVRSLASLAYEGRRRELFTAELVAALRLIDSGATTREGLIGSWAGATGQSQFLPSSYLAHAADGNGDGRADIWNSRSDTLASIANYFVGKGWRRGEPWATRVHVPASFNREQVKNLTPVAECAGLNWKHSRWLPVRAWRELGIAAAEGMLADDAVLATLIEPDGGEGEAYLTYSNYRALMRYNCSNYYALTASQLAEAIGRNRAATAHLASTRTSGGSRQAGAKR